MPKIEVLTIFETVDEGNLEQFVEGIKEISRLNCLKRLNCEISISENSIIESIPFEAFKNQNIAYDLRIDTNDKNPPKINLTGLIHTDFLGISCLREDYLIPLHNQFQLSSVDLQRQARNRFFLQGADQGSFENLVENCKNIRSLDLVFSGLLTHHQGSIPDLSHLTNLQHLSIKIFGLNNSFEKQWKTLAELTKRNKNLTYLSLNFKTGQTTKDSNKNIELFFNAVKDSLTTLLLSFGAVNVDISCFKIFAENISSLQKLKSLYLDSLPLINSLKTSIPCGLEELKLNINENITIKSLEPLIRGKTKLQKLSLEVKSLEKNLNFSKVLSSLTELKDLELVIDTFPKTRWNDLVRAVPKLNNLEILKFASKDKKLSFDDENTIQQIMKDHPNLKLVAFGHPNETLRVVVRKKYVYNIDTFLCRFQQGLLHNLDYKISEI